MPEKKNDSKVTTTNVKIPKKKSSAQTPQKKDARSTVQKSIMQEDSNGAKRPAKGGSGSNGSRTRSYLNDPNTSNTSNASNGKRASQSSKGKETRAHEKERNGGRAAEPTEAQLRRHQFVPLFLILGALLVGLSYLTTVKESGIFGTVVRTVFYGVFGISSFAIPVLLVIAALNWQKYVRAQTILLNIILFCLTMLLVSSFVEIIVLAVDAVPSGDWSVSIKNLFLDGMELRNGGVIGGLVGILCWNIFGSVGSFFVLIAVILVLMFSLFGATPVTVVTYIRYKLKVASEKRRERARLEAEKKEREDDVSYLSKRKKSSVRENAFSDTSKRARTDDDNDVNEDPEESVRLVSSPRAKGTEKSENTPLERRDTEDNIQNIQNTDSAVSDDADAADASKREIKRPNVTIVRNQGTDDQGNIQIENEEAKAESHENLSSIGCNQAFTRRIISHNSDVSNENGDMDEGLQDTLDVGSRANSHVQFCEDVQIGMSDIPEATEHKTADNAEPVDRKPVKELDDVHNLDDIIEGISFDDKSESFGRPDKGIKASKANLPPEQSRGDLTLEVEKTVLTDIEEEVLKPDPYANYVFPPTSLLAAPTPNQGITDEEINKSIDRLMDTLTSFKIRVSDISCSCGPTITRFEVKPEAGVRVRSIAGLVDDIALGLAKTGVRIEAPIPGKSAVGIEVPNDRAQTVQLRSLIENKAFTDMKSKISACLGADVSGKPITFDIHKMPHLLIAGATGMGKSVCINSIIVSLLYKSKPDEVKLILIDPKKVEFGIYKDIPHLYVPIVSNPKKAAGALASAVAEMERRFAIMEEVGVRDIAKYNEITKDDPDMEFMPQIVIIIDELADLMMTAPDDVENSICRITQKARAAGIHLIIGTQRPSVDVITGLIKANIPSRIAFTVASQVDSRTIIDIAGAEKLIGRGDMLYAPVGAAKPMRVQGSYVSESEVEAVCEFIKRHNGKAIYNEQFTKQIDQEAEKCGMSKKGMGSSAMSASSDDGDFTGDGEDPKLREAIEIVVTDQKASTSLLQRKLSIGYGRAAKIIDRMQELNIVSPPDGNKPRRILITKEQFMEMYLNDDI